MKPAKWALLFLSVVAATAFAPVSHAHGGRVHFGIAVGGPYWYYPPPYYYYPPPYYYYPPVVAVPSAPPVYIERNDASERANAYWYYCPDSKAYYPYVKECASPWQRVEPRPPS